MTQCLGMADKVEFNFNRRRQQRRWRLSEIRHALRRRAAAAPTALRSPKQMRPPRNTNVQSRDCTEPVEVSRSYRYVNYNQLIQSEEHSRIPSSVTRNIHVTLYSLMQISLTFVFKNINQVQAPLQWCAPFCFLHSFVKKKKIEIIDSLKIVEPVAAIDCRAVQFQLICWIPVWLLFVVISLWLEIEIWLLITSSELKLTQLFLQNGASEMVSFLHRRRSASDSCRYVHCTEAPPYLRSIWIHHRPSPLPLAVRIVDVYLVPEQKMETY